MQATESMLCRRRLLRDVVRHHSTGSVGKDLDHHSSCLQHEFVDSSSPRFHRSTITSPLTDTEPQGQLAPAAGPLHTSPDATPAGSPPHHLSRGHCGVIRVCCHDRTVPPGVGSKSIRHQSEARGFTQALALHVCRDSTSAWTPSPLPSSKTASLLSPPSSLTSSTLPSVLAVSPHPSSSPLSPPSSKNLVWIQPSLTTSGPSPTSRSYPKH
ncbi:uncharacterized protein LOC129349299 [Amphiprion ocellaris]|uniref:uncharacterized protein LOC129349299 n=1 Tax=Amphiprion ocellaris TaxID=80972 RepID=UPI002411078A|nr:uncharacterized protein LOC129349299 [Amphiprion ocellaris]